jgi:putative aldouronate transport system substrate-binding protein
MNRKKAFTIFLSIILIISMVSACGTAPVPAATSTPIASAAETATPVPATAEPAATEVASAEPSAATEEVITYKMATWANRPVWPEYDKNIMLQGLEKRFNLKLDVEVVNAQYGEKLNLLAASGDLPDIFVDTQAWTATEKWARDGLLLNLDPFMDIMVNFKDVRKEQVVWDSLKVDGKLFELPALSNPQDGIPQIRADWLKNLNLKAPNTLEEFYAVAKAFRENDPDGNGKKDTWGAAMFNAMEFHSPLGIVYCGMDAFPDSWYIDASGKAAYGVTRDDWKEAIKYVRKMVQDDLINIDNVEITDWGQAQNELYSGKYGMFIFPAQVMTANDPRTQQLAKATNGGMMIPFEPLTNKAGTKVIKATGLRPWNRTGLSAKIKAPERAMGMLDWMISQEGSDYVFYGIEGKNYNRVDGKIVFIPPYNDPINLYNEGWDEQFQLFTFRSLFGPHLDKEALDGYAMIQKDMRFDKVYNGDLASEAKVMPNINPLIATFRSKALYDKGFDVDAEFPKFVEELNKAGLAEMTKEAEAFVAK